MAFDAGMLRLLANEIKNLGECKVEKVYQPSNDEIIISLHSIKRKSVRLLINAGSNCPRINLTQGQYENPLKAPMLCMLLRKHIGGAKLTDASCYGYERVCQLEFDAYDEMGFKTKKYLICEIMGKYSNIILTDSAKRIIALLKSVDFTTSEKRQLLVGMHYELPPKQDKLDTLNVSRLDFERAFDSAPKGIRCDKFILGTFLGIAPSTARQIAFLTAKDTEALLENVKKQTLLDVFFDFTEKMRNMELKPYLVTDENGAPFEFSYLPIEYLGHKYKNEEYDSFSALVDAYYLKKGQNERIKQKSSDILRLLTNAETRITRKISIQTEELEQCKEADKYRIIADLITANLGMIKKGARQASVINYYDDECPTIIVPLEEQLSPSQNAQKYYKKYTKLKKAKEILSTQIELAKKELEYIYTVFDALGKAEKENDLLQIRDELFCSGYASKMKNYSHVKQGTPQPLKFKTSGGYTVLCGKNNVQNDYITFKLAEKTDWWFHVKNSPGSHVLMQCNGEEPSEKDFTEAAEIAAYYSKSEGNNIAVDYTYAKHIKKPAGSKPGYVIYHVNWTAYVTPNEKAIQKLQQK